MRIDFASDTARAALDAKRLVNIAMLAGVCVLSALPRAAHAGDCDAMPVAASKVEWVSRDMTLNGAPTQAAIVTYNAGTDDVTRAFLQYWKDHDTLGTLTHAQQNQNAVLLSAINHDCSYTLQLPTGQRTPVRGLFSAMSLDADPSTPRVLRPSNYPLPAGKVMLDMTSHDGNKTSRTVQITLADASLAQASRHYADDLTQAGWRQLAGGPALAGHAPTAYGYALAMQKGAYRLDAAFSRAQGAPTVMINVVYE